MEGNTLMDTDVVREKTSVSHQEVVHLAQLTAEEKVLEINLRRRVDSLIMPLIILVYLMNYIDRFVKPGLSGLFKDLNLLLILCSLEITMPQQNYKVLLRSFNSLIKNIRPDFPFCSSPTFLCKSHPISCSIIWVDHRYI